MNFFEPFIDLLLPPRCPCCGQVVQTKHSLCATCFEKIDFISAPYCKICGMPFETQADITKNYICPACAHKKPITRMNRSAILYNEFAQKTVLAFKFGDRTDLTKIFAKWMLAASFDILKDGVDLIVPVPLSYLRLLKRRYNQSALLAKELSLLTGIEKNFSALVKIKNTKPQSLLKSNARLKNVKGAYKVKHPQSIKGKKILLIDDVMTTGSTLNECAKTLLKAGALSVDTLTLARVKKE